MPALCRLQSVPRDQIGAPNRYLTQIARDNSHNSLCYEMRLSFALGVERTWGSGRPELAFAKPSIQDRSSYRCHPM